ncbi:hypothetical protein Aduo_017565 [Ancylostoma duodenale]
MNIQAAARGVLRVAFETFAQATSSGGYGSTIKGVGLRPVQNRAVLLKLCLVAASSLYFGGFIAHKGASYLEENEIFVPADDDDDD